MKFCECEQFPADEETVLVLLERVNEAQRLAAREMRELQAQDPHKKKRKRGEGGGDDMDKHEGSDTVVKNVFKQGAGGGGGGRMKKKSAGKQK